MKDWLYPGAKVVCVNDENSPLERGRIYTVRCVLDDAPRPAFYFNCAMDEVGILLAEVEPPWPHVGFTPRRFRPLTKRNTDAQVEKLKRLLNTTPADLEAVE